MLCLEEWASLLLPYDLARLFGGRGQVQCDGPIDLNYGNITDFVSFKDMKRMLRIVRIWHSGYFM